VLTLAAPRMLGQAFQLAGLLYIEEMRHLYLRLFLRIVNKNRDVYILKILTLSVAFACAIVISLFVFNEFGYDKFHDNSDSAFRILQKNISDGFIGNRYSNQIHKKVVSSLSSTFRDSLTLSPVKVMDGLAIIAGNKTWHGQKLHVADLSITSVFTFDVAQGDLSNFVAASPSIILSTSTSIRYFGSPLSVGKRLSITAINDTIEVTVAAVFKDFPTNSHENFNAFVVHDSSTISALNFDLTRSGLYGRVNAKNILHFQKSIDAHLNDLGVSYILQPIADIYFGPRVIGEDAKHGDSYSIYILLCITSLILFLAVTGFVNLTTLTVPHRSKELAIKKIAGMNEFGLLSGFAKESLLIVFISFITAIITLFCLKQWIQPVLSMNIVSPFRTIGLEFTLSTILLLLMFGLSPLLITSRFTRATPNRLLSSESITFPRFKRVIALLQLGICLFLIVASLVVRRQINYSLIKEPGQNHDQIVYLDYPHHLPGTLAGLRASLKQLNNANVVDVIATSQLPNKINSKELGTDFYFIKVDPEFKDFFDLKILGGNWFMANDGDSIVVVNERAKQLMGADTTNVIGTVSSIDNEFNLPEKPLKISKSNAFEYNFLCIRLLEVDIRRTVETLSNYFATSGTPATIRFLNTRFEQWLAYQDRLNSLSGIMAIISGLLACCSIYGLCVSIVREKIKQIAIHKLFGASVKNITILLVKEFALQLGLAVLFFGPVTYIVIQEILRSFVYRTHFVWLDPLIPVLYFGIVITLLCGLQANTLNRADLTASLKA
jgi:putative ABC transport system permease protein